VLETAGLPIGLFSREQFSVGELQLEAGDGLVIYSDGVSEAADDVGGEYGADRLRDLIRFRQALSPAALLAACRDDLALFRRDAPKLDDVTLFVLGRGVV
jgi:sigma-B regulation protein RsbU (phosphoserine phosphatase)